MNLKTDERQVFKIDGNIPVIYKNIDNKSILGLKTNKDTFFGINWISKTASEEYRSIASITGLVDPEGYNSNEIVTGKIIFNTTNDDGILKKRLEIDKNGRVTIFGQLSATTHLPSGQPLIIQSHYDEKSDGCRAVFRRSRNTYLEPTSVINNDTIFRIVFSAHDGVQYKDSATLSAVISGIPSTGIVPSDFIFKTTDKKGTMNEAVRITSENVVVIKNLLKIATHKSTIDIENPEKGMIIFNDDLHKFQGFNGVSWVDLHS